MKIGIVTFNSAHNYGAVLQAWALQEYLKSQGHDPSIINYRINNIDKIYRIYKPKNPFKSKTMNKAVHKAQLVKAYGRDKDKYKRYKAFEKFINKTLNTTQPPAMNFTQLSQRDWDFDVMISGSDQVWNGSFTKMNGGYFLDFGRPEIKRISYAASIGKDEISPEEELKFQKYIHNFDYISVREQKAKEQVMKFTDEPVELVCDPTLLLPRSKYDELKVDPKINQKYIYVHNVHLVKIDERLNAMAEELSRKTGLPIVHNRPDYSYTNECGKFLGGGPNEFLGWIAHSEYVITNSFHATVFAMIYHRNFITIPHFKNPDRMRYLLSSLGIPEHLMGDPNEIPDDLSTFEIDYDMVEEKRAAMTESSKAFLTKALAGPRTTGEFAKRKTYFDLADPFTCYGCRACEAKCPEAVSMVADKDGFIYPQVNADNQGNTEWKDVCIYKNPSVWNKEPKQQKFFAAYNKEEDVKVASSSGGVFTALANTVIEKKGHVAGVKLNEENQGVYALASTKDECAAFRGAKYVTPESAGMKQKVKELLDNKEVVLYSGNPCEIAGLRSFLGKDYDNLYTVDMLCTGIPSPEVYNQYIKALEEKYNSKIVSIEFDSKFRGKAKGYTIVTFESGEVYLQETRKDDYMNCYRNKNLQRPSCYACEFMNGEDSVADITLGRFKNAAQFCKEMDDMFGTSYVQVNTRKGMELWENAESQLAYKEVEEENLNGMNKKKPIGLTLQRSQLMLRVGQEEIMKVLRSYNSTKRRRKKK